MQDLTKLRSDLTRVVLVDNSKPGKGSGIAWTRRPLNHPGVAGLLSKIRITQVCARSHSVQASSRPKRTPHNWRAFQWIWDWPTLGSGIGMLLMSAFLPRWMHTENPQDPFLFPRKQKPLKLPGLIPKSSEIQDFRGSGSQAAKGHERSCYLAGGPSGCSPRTAFLSKIGPVGDFLFFAQKGVFYLQGLKRASFTDDLLTQLSDSASLHVGMSPEELQAQQLCLTGILMTTSGSRHELGLCSLYFGAVLATGSSTFVSTAGVRIRKRTQSP